MTEQTITRQQLINWRTELRNWTLWDAMKFLNIKGKTNATLRSYESGRRSIPGPVAKLVLEDRKALLRRKT